MSEGAHKAEERAAERRDTPADVLAEAQQASGGIAIQCQFCVGRNFRRSRLRRTDLKQLLLMRYPVRCLRCSQRQMVSFSVAGISVPSHVKHVPERSGTLQRRAATADTAGGREPGQ